MLSVSVECVDSVSFFLFVCVDGLLSLICFREELVKECVTEGTKLVQAIADTLFNFPSTESVDGPLVQLPPPTTKLPREKHVRSSS